MMYTSAFFMTPSDLPQPRKPPNPSPARPVLSSREPAAGHPARRREEGNGPTPSCRGEDGLSACAGGAAGRTGEAAHADAAAGEVERRLELLLSAPAGAVWEGVSRALRLGGCRRCFADARRSHAPV